MTRIRIDGKLYGVNSKKVWRIAEGGWNMPDLAAGEITDAATIKAVRDRWEQLRNQLASILQGERIPLDIWNNSTGEIIILANRKITPFLINKFAYNVSGWDTDPSPIRSRLQQIFAPFDI